MYRVHGSFASLPRKKESSDATTNKPHTSHVYGSICPSIKLLEATKPFLEPLGHYSLMANAMERFHTWDLRTDDTAELCRHIEGYPKQTTLMIEEGKTLTKTGRVKILEAVTNTKVNEVIQDRRAACTVKEQLARSPSRQKALQTHQH